MGETVGMIQLDQLLPQPVQLRFLVRRQWRLVRHRCRCLFVIFVRLRSGPLVIRLGLFRLLLPAAQQEIEILLPIIQHQPQPVALLVMLAQSPKGSPL